MVNVKKFSGDYVPVITGSDQLSSIGSDKIIQCLISQKTHCLLSKLLGAVCDQEMLTINYIKSFTAYGRGDDRPAKCH
jgi:hypothetical protein